jgi:uncharacterized protein YkwD
MGRLRIVVALLLLVLGISLIGKKPKPAPEPQQCRPVPVQQYPISPYEKEVIRLTNIERTSRGLQPLKVTEPLMRDAQKWSGVQASRGRMFHSKMGHGENVAWNYNTPESVMNAWMNSPGHRRNILNPRYRQIGVGAVTSSRGIYATQCFE